MPRSPRSLGICHRKPSPLKVRGLPADPLMFQTLIRLATLVRSGITGWQAGKAGEESPPEYGNTPLCSGASPASGAKWFNSNHNSLSLPPLATCINIQRTSTPFFRSLAVCPSRKKPPAQPKPTIWFDIYRRCYSGSGPLGQRNFRFFLNIYNFFLPLVPTPTLSFPAIPQICVRFLQILLARR